MSPLVQGRPRSCQLKIMFDQFLYQPILQTLTFLANLFQGNLGLAILALTLIMRTLLSPLTLPSLRSAKKLRDLKPELDHLKQKHQDKMELQKAQLALYQKHGINPAAGCLPNILQLIVLIALYRVFMTSLQNGAGNFSTTFLWLDLVKPDPLYILPIIAGVSQLLLSLMLSPAIEHHPEKTLKKTEGTQDMAETMQQQMLFIMPVMTAVIALRFPSGLALYWVATTIFSVVQQYLVSGWGGIIPAFKKLRAVVKL